MSKGPLVCFSDPLSGPSEDRERDIQREERTAGQDSRLPMSAGIRSRERQQGQDVSTERYLDRNRHRVRR